MCGIAGSINFPLNTQKLVQTLGHRGPDQQRSLQKDNLDFFHARLSIQDLTDAGAQPMQLRDRYTIVFNGEIYNHMELRSRFALQANTRSDTETILLLYEKLGPAFLNELDGMFAIAIYDAEKKQLFLARDRAGKKPLHVYQHQDTLVFASELNALRSQVSLEIEDSHFLLYLRLGVFFRSQTPYKNTTELTAGTYWIIDTKTLQQERHTWWSIADFYHRPCNDSVEEALQKTEMYLQQGVRRRVESSDLPVGCFLSGGIDSGLVVAMASACTSNLKTITVSMGGKYDEAPLAQLVATKYGTDHQEITISYDNLKNEVEQIIAGYGEPFFDSSQIPSYYVSKAAKQIVTVVLNGDGADELFGGYRRYVPFSKYDFFKSGTIIRSMAGLISGILPASHEKKSTYSHITRLFSMASRSDLEIYFSATIDIIEGFEKHIRSHDQSYLNPIRDHFRRITNHPVSGLKKLMNMDFDTNLFSDLLVKMDIATMAHSLEGRSPFLCKELLEYAPTLPDKLKINGATTKYLLRRLGEKYLPSELVTQPKRGFEVPLKDMVNNDLNELIRGYLDASDALYPAFLDKAFVQRMLNGKELVPSEKRAKMIWMLFCMEVWHKKVFQRA